MIEKGRLTVCPRADGRVACLSERLLHFPSVFIPVLLWVFTAGECGGCSGSSPAPLPAPCVAAAGGGRQSRGGVKLEGGDQSCRPALGSCGCGFAVLGGAAATLTPGPPDVITSWSLCVWKKALCVRWRTRRPLGLWAAAGENAHVLGQVIPKAYLPRARAALPRLVSRRPCTTLPT